VNTHNLQPDKLQPDKKQQWLTDDLTPGLAVELSDQLVRVVADNGSVMTGAGTNSYLLGRGSLTLIDAGPKSSNHCQAILDAAKGRGRIDYIALTHTHSDHSPGVEALRHACGAKVVLYPEPSGKPFSDTPVHADQGLRHEDYIVGSEVKIQAIHTPGHASNHLCFYWPEQKILFTGDHLMNGSSVVIAPPDGNMTDYLASLALVKSYEIDYLAPGHGALMDQPYALVDQTIAHRLGREKKVIEALQSMPQGNIQQVLKKAYADTPEFLHGLAKLSLTAHLEKLVQEGCVVTQEDHSGNNDILWRLV